MTICTGSKIAAYLSDISGAFDRVFKDYLLAKLCSAGVSDCFLNFLISYLQPRRAVVVVEGICSDEFEIANQVFQGTVLGPPLWNTFFSDVSIPASSTGGEPSIFADDLSVFQKFDRKAKNSDCLNTMEKCRKKVHSWGRANRVIFDPLKEHAIILHSVQGEGDPFKLLGLLVDCKLIMLNAVEKILSQVRPKVQAILRTRKFYDNKQLIGQFKTHVWGLLECHNGGIFHAASYILSKIDDVHYNFLEKIGVSAEEAFLNYNFAPPTLRRDIGILGLLHKRVLGLGHPIFQQLFPFIVDVGGDHLYAGHDKQLHSHLSEANFQLSMFCRSIFGMTYVYNLLSQDIVNCEKVSAFQTSLTKHARKLCESGDPNWSLCFSCRK